MGDGALFSFFFFFGQVEYGVFLISWFAGTAEGKPDVGIFVSTCSESGCNTPAQVSQKPFFMLGPIVESREEYSAVVFSDRLVDSKQMVLIILNDKIRCAKLGRSAKGSAVLEPSPVQCQVWNAAAVLQGMRSFLRNQRRASASF